MGDLQRTLQERWFDRPATEPNPGEAVADVESVIDALDHMEPDEFRKFVDDNVRGKASPEVAAALQSPRLVRRWLSTLQSAQRSVEGQFAAKESDMKALQAEYRLKDDRQAWLTAQAENERWRAGAIRFKTGLDQQIIQAEHIVRELDGGDTQLAKTIEERDRALARVAMLEDAIRRHRDGFPKDDESSDADEELWQHVR